MIHVTIPGPPVPQGRPRIYVRGQHAHGVDPPKSKSWKGAAQVHMLEQCEKPFGRDVPLGVEVWAIFPCPKSDYRKREPRESRWHIKRGDIDNVAKAVLDAGQGVLWEDDCQVCYLLAKKFIAAQGDSPRVEVDVWEVNE